MTDGERQKCISIMRAIEGDLGNPTVPSEFFVVEIVNMLKRIIGDSAPDVELDHILERRRKLECLIELACNTKR